MKITWIKPGIEISPGLEEGQMELEYFPGIPMTVIFSHPEPGLVTDMEERQWLLIESDKIIREIEANLLTRRALFYNEYPSKELKFNCSSLYHFMVRNNKLELFVYIRSMNLKNLGFD